MTIQQQKERLRYVASMAWKAEVQSIVTISPETCIEDLIYCIRTNPKKLSKRIKRLEFCLRCFADISDSLKQQAEKTISEYKPKILTNNQGFDEEYFRQLHNIEEYFCTSTDTKVPFFIESDQEPANVLFNDELKKCINADGKVYKIFSQVAVIALAMMKSDMDNSFEDDNIRMAVKDMKIVFKGGAAMGHFLLRDPKIWETLSQQEREYVDSTFINGGDNDTSLVFTNDVDDELRGLLLRGYMNYVANVMSEFQVDKLMKSYVRQAELNTIVCFGDEFFIQATKRRSYDIVDYVEGIKTLAFDKTMPKSNLYFTYSKCSFDTRDGRSDFYLSRIKSAFQVYSTNSIARRNKKISCNAECLDVSVATTKDVRPFTAKYICVSLLD